MNENTIKFAHLTKKSAKNENEQVGILRWSTWKGYPRATVMINDLNNSGGGDYDRSKRIVAPFTPQNLSLFYYALESAIESKEDVNHKIECWNTKFVDNKKTDEKEIQSVVSIGRKDGIIYMGIIAEGRPKFKFIFLTNEAWHKLRKNNEIVSDVSLMSEIEAKAYLYYLKLAFGTEYMLQPNNIVKPKTNYNDTNDLL
jgi:hypothetical protein